MNLTYSMIEQRREPFLQPPLRMEVPYDEPQNEEKHYDTKNGPFHDLCGWTVPPESSVIINNDKLVSFLRYGAHTAESCSGSHNLDGLHGEERCFIIWISDDACIVAVNHFEFQIICETNGATPRSYNTALY